MQPFSTCQLTDLTTKVVVVVSFLVCVYVCGHSQGIGTLVMFQLQRCQEIGTVVDPA